MGGMVPTVEWERYHTRLQMGIGLLCPSRSLEIQGQPGRAAGTDPLAPRSSLPGPRQNLTKL